VANSELEYDDEDDEDEDNDDDDDKFGDHFINNNSDLISYIKYCRIKKKIHLPQEVPINIGYPS
jgi:hypothetical protein